ncbi:MAG TPA: helix-turn-helix domain-containing protein [Anaerolineales bacterium]
MPISIPASTLDKFTTFGDLLRFLRRRVGLTQMELADTVGYSHTQISRLEQNLRLPDLPIIQSNFVQALGLEGEPKVVERLVELAGNVRREDAPTPGLCPYKGLNYYDESDEELFVGREALTSRLVERILAMNTNVEAVKERFLAIVGASGSGKSSLVRAGVVPALRWNKTSAGWMSHVITPGEHPLQSLASFSAQDNSTSAQTLAREMAGNLRGLQEFASQGIGLKHNAHLLLVVDQFEELFTLCRSEEERSAFIGNLLAACADAEGLVTIVITLRADFYAHCANYPALREALARQQEYIGAMDDEELRRAIEEPARRGRWELEPGLADLLLHDVGHEPGALPLLSHALLETWERRRGRTMTLSGYSSSGGVRGAIAETAETVFTDQFTREQQSIARRIFLRLTELSDEASTADTRRRATFNELILKPEDAGITHSVLTALANARLITTSEGAAEVAHEALIREWPTLRGWLEENRDGLRLHHQLTGAAQEWDQAQRSEDLLFRGARLAQVREWAAAHSVDMNVLEREFLDASQAWADHDAAGREEQRQRELAVAQKLAETERTRAEEQTHSAVRLKLRNRIITAVGAAALILALLAGLFGVQSKQNEIAAQNNAATAQIAKNNALNAQATASANFTRSEAQRLALEANTLMLSNEDPNLVALLAIRSLKMQYTPTGDAVLSSLTSLPAPPRTLKGHVGDTLDVAISPDGKTVAAGGADQSIYLWDFATGKTIRVLYGHSADVTGVDFSPDGKYLVSASYDRTARLWDVATGQTVQVFTGQSDKIEFVIFSPDGQNILTTGPGEARVWDIATGKTLHIISDDHSIVFYRARYSPDGKYFILPYMDTTARLYDAVTGEQIRVFELPKPNAVTTVAFSPDGKTFATASADKIARLWDFSSGKVIREYVGHKDFFNDIRFSPDGRFLLTANLDHTARLWEVATGKELRIFGGITTAVMAALFSPDGKFVITTNRSDVQIWNLQASPGGMVFTGHIEPVRKASFSPDGKRIVTASNDLTARIWEVGSGQTLMILRGHNLPVTDAVFSPDGRLVLTGSGDKTARLWDASTGQELRRFEGHTDEVEKVLFSPDGKTIVTASYDGTAKVWETQTGKNLLTYTNQNSGQLIRAAFSPDGRTVATSGQDKTARIWDPKTGKDLMVFKGHMDIVTGVAFSPDGSQLLTASWDGTARLWEVASGKEIRQFTGHTGTVFGAAFSPDGRQVLTSGADRTARLWDVQTGQELRRFAGHTDDVRYVAFSPDGKSILTASQDGTARLWLVDLQANIQAVCAALTRDLTPEEQKQFGIAGNEPTCPAK